MPLPGTPEEYFDILGTGQKEWRMAFRGTAGIKKSMYDAYKDGRGIPSYVEEGCKSTVGRLTLNTEPTITHCFLILHPLYDITL